MLIVGTGSTRAYLLLFAVVLRLGCAASAPHNSETTKAIRTRRSFLNPWPTSCLVPEQPTYGQWKLHGESCDGGQDCQIPQGIMLRSGSQLVYRCDPEYRITGSPDVYCKASGTWSAIPSCIATFTNLDTSEHNEVIFEIDTTRSDDQEFWTCRNSTCRRIYRIRAPWPQARSMPLAQESRLLQIFDSDCVVPPQPSNGQWKLHQKFCNSTENCDVPQDTTVKRDGQLVYTCAENFVLRGSSDVYCYGDREWKDIPSCVPTTCSSLNSISRAATCSRFGDRVSCKSTILPHTIAKVTCRINYGLDIHSESGVEQSVECNSNGRWEPEPIECTPVCGVVNSAEQNQLSRNEFSTEAGVLPWFANLWREIQPERLLRLHCSATIIRINLVVTAAYCVIDEGTKKADDPRHFRVDTERKVDNNSDGAGNSKLHEVKNVYRYCEDFGVGHGYTSDIALLEMKDPFLFSSEVLPVCLDTSSFSEQDLKPGTTGKIGGLEIESVSRPGRSMHTANVTYVPDSECKLPHNHFRRSAIISKDQFCSVHLHEANVCIWQEGGGFVVPKKGLWHLMGVFFVKLGSGLRDMRGTCDSNPYGLYTKVPLYMAWIQDVTFQLERYKFYPLCFNDNDGLFVTIHRDDDSSTSVIEKWSHPQFVNDSTTVEEIERYDYPMTVAPDCAHTATPVVITGKLSSSMNYCSVPSQPADGELKLYQKSCDETEYDIQTGAQLGLGSQLIYKCNPGFQINGNSDGRATCTDSGLWSATFECTDVRCNSLDSESRRGTCFRSGIEVPCNSSALPKTIASITCRRGYKQDMSDLRVAQATVVCSTDGKWKPNPIICVPDGKAAEVKISRSYATLHRRRDRTGGPTEFICSATIIAANLLLTAAHCVYDDRFEAVQLPEKFIVAAGSVFRDHDSLPRNPKIVQKSTVKNVYVPCEYTGPEGNYASDIALVELQEPFKLSSILWPASLDVLGNVGLILEAGAVGELAGFGGARGMFSDIMLSKAIEYVGLSQCNISARGGEREAPIAQDKFCGRSRGEFAVCAGDDGGGLTLDYFRTSYVMGILSVSSEVDASTGEIICDGKGYSLYTKVFSHMAWILDVMSYVDRDKPYPSCGTL